MKRCAVWAAAAVAACAAWGQVQTRHVPEEASWALHLDLRALNGSAMGRFLRQTLDSNARRGLASFQSMSGIDLTNDVDAVVVYGTGSAQTSGVMVVYGRFDTAKLTAVAGGAKAYQNKALGERSLLSWTDKGRRTNLCFADPTVAVLSQDEQAVREAVERIDGQRPGLKADGAFARVLSHKPGRFLSVQALDVKSLALANPQAQLFRQAEAVLLEVGQLAETNGLDLALAIKAQTAEMAQQFSQAAQGIQALLQLQAAQNPEAAALAQSVKIGLEGDVVSVGLSLTEERLRKLVQVRIQQQKEAAEARRAARRAAAEGAEEGGEGAAGGEKPERPAF